MQKEINGWQCNSTWYSENGLYRINHEQGKKYELEMLCPMTSRWIWYGVGSYPTLAAAAKAAKRRPLPPWQGLPFGGEYKYVQ
jgi:hypothetical protein